MLEGRLEEVAGERWQREREREREREYRTRFVSHPAKAR